MSKRLQIYVNVIAIIMKSVLHKQNFLYICMCFLLCFQHTNAIGYVFQHTRNFTFSIHCFPTVFIQNVKTISFYTTNLPVLTHKKVYKFTMLIFANQLPCKRYTNQIVNKHFSMYYLSKLFMEP